MSNQKLNSKQVREIYELYKQGASAFSLASRHNVSYNTIMNIVLGKTWKELKLDPIKRRRIENGI